MNILIAVVAYNRPQCLKRILDALSKSVYSNITDLVISIDYSGESHCTQIAHDFQWKFGKKKIISRTTNLGLRNHILNVGDLVEEYDALVLLEDDIVVSPDYYMYFTKAVRQASLDDNIAGISLYNFQKNLINWREFTPLGDSYDNYFMQVPCSWGQGWTKEQWAKFKVWYLLNKDVDLRKGELPLTVKLWPESSWLKYFYQYLIVENKFFFYPKSSFSTNMGDKGTHHKSKTNFITSDLSYGFKSFNFCKLYETLNVFDSYFEIILSDRTKKNLGLKQDLTVDLYGQKPLNEIRTNYLISTKCCKNPITIYSFMIFPLHLNLFLRILNEEESFHFNYGKTKNFTINNENADFPSRFSPEESRYLIQLGKKEIQNSRSYKLGYFLLHPLYFFNRLFQKLTAYDFLRK